MPATAEASSTPCMVCPITGPGARQMAESRDRCTSIPGPVRPMRRTTAGITEAWTTPQRGHPPIRRLLGGLPAADASPLAGAPPTGGLAHAHHPARADLTSMGGHRPGGPRTCSPDPGQRRGAAHPARRPCRSPTSSPPPDGHTAARQRRTVSNCPAGGQALPSRPGEADTDRDSVTPARPRNVIRQAWYLATDRCRL